MKRLLVVLAAVLLIIPVVCVAQAADARRPVKIDGKKHLPLRVLARPFSHVYKSQDIQGGTVKENVPAFQPFYVYTRPSEQERANHQGWYEVGTDARGTIIGWMQAKDVFEWKQAMCLAYTHPQGRHPVLMFAQEAPLVKLVQDPPAQRTADVEKLYKEIKDKNIPPDFPVKSVEPEKAVDIAKQFYLLPILDFKEIDIDGREGRVIKLAAVTGAGPDARQSSDIRENKQYVDQATTGSTSVSAETIKNVNVDIVFVMDTTVSMRPNITSTLNVIKQVAANVAGEPDVAKSIKFGFWGYRDSARDIPGIGYTTKNYTPQLQSADQFQQTMANVNVTKIDSVDYAEDMFSGVDEAMRKTAWTPDAIKLMVLVGDAPGHELGHKWNLSGQNENTLRAIADDESLYILALHIQNPRATKYNPRAEEQYRVLSTNPGSGNALYSTVPSKDLAAYQAATDAVTNSVLNFVRSAKQGKVDPVVEKAGPVMPPSAPNPTQAGELAGLDPEPTPEGAPAAPTAAPSAAPQTSIADQTANMTNQALKAALVQWIGRQTGTQAPRDIEAWAVDKDLIEPAITSMEVRLLVNKRQLSSLKDVLTEVLGAGRLGQIGGEDFFTALQATAATAARDPNQIKNARTMAETGLVPEFLVGLPYKSRLMDMTNELWQGWGPDQQDEFLNELEARIAAYQAIHESPDGWIALNEGDDEGDKVYPISLELLP